MGRIIQGHIDANARNRPFHVRMLDVGAGRFNFGPDGNWKAEIRDRILIVEYAHPAKDLLMMPISRMSAVGVGNNTMRGHPAP